MKPPPWRVKRVGRRAGEVRSWWEGKKMLWVGGWLVCWLGVERMGNLPDWEFSPDGVGLDDVGPFGGWVVYVAEATVETHRDGQALEDAD